MYFNVSSTSGWWMFTGSLRPHPGWVAQLEQVLVEPKERVLPQLMEEYDVEADKFAQKSPLQVVMENSSLARVDRPMSLVPIVAASQKKPIGRPLEGKNRPIEKALNTFHIHSRRWFSGNLEIRLACDDILVYRL